MKTKNHKLKNVRALNEKLIAVKKTKLGINDFYFYLNLFESASLLIFMIILENNNLLPYQNRLVLSSMYIGGLTFGFINLIISNLMKDCIIKKYKDDFKLEITRELLRD